MKLLHAILTGSHIMNASINGTIAIYIKYIQY